MTLNPIKIFIDKVNSETLERNYPTNKTNVYYVDDFWRLDMLDLKNHGPENNRKYRYVLVVIDNFSKFGWTARSKNKNAQTIKDSIEIILITSKSKPSLIETNRGKGFYNNIFKSS